MAPVIRRPGRDDADALLVAAGRGDLAAFAAFYDLTSPSVFGLLRGFLPEPGAADRATEEVYLQVWRRAPEFDPTGRSARATVLLLARRELVGRIHALSGPPAVRTRAGPRSRPATRTRQDR